MATTYEWDRLGSEIMDSRELIAVAEEIKAALEDYDSDGDETALEALECNTNGSPEDTATEAREILAAIEEIEIAGIEDWTYGATFIRSDYFQAYAEEFAEDIGAVSRDAAWPLTYIDWEAAADALKEDYIEVSYRGSTYYARG